MANIEINGIPIEAHEGQMVIEAADEAGITIPRFCYHKKLSIAANCRMCLVEVEKANKPLPACATPVTDGMKVFTRSPKALAAQKSVLEFLLINHPLDCPICDQGGECDLQEMSMGFGQDVSRYAEGKRVVPNPDLGPLIATDMTRCIHCTRCVRFGEEVAGLRELGATGRGEDTRIGTYVEHTVSSELSGNVIDLCPVGALTSKPFRYTARPWELTAHNGVSPHDCVGANLKVDVRRGEVMRVLPRENEAVNETWIADRDRYSYLGLGAPDRLTTPMVKEGGTWREVDWDTALTRAAEGLKKAVNDNGADRIGALGADWATVEELFLLQRLMRGLGSGNVDHRLRQVDFRYQDQAPVFPTLGQDLADLDGLEAALLVGSNIHKDQPLIGHRLRKAALGGGWIAAVNTMDYGFHFELGAHLVANRGDLATELAAVAAALLAETGESAPAGLKGLIEGVQVGDAHREVAQRLKAVERATVLLGSGAAAHPAQSELRALAALIGRVAGATVGQVPEGGNSAGAWLAGAVPHREAGGRPAEVVGRDWRAMLEAGLQGYLLLGIEPELDCADPSAAVAALDAAQCVVAVTPYASERMQDYADVLLPSALFPETSGTLVNCEGRWQDFTGCARAPGEARPAWKVLRVLGNLLDLEGFDYLSSEEIRNEAHGACGAAEPVVWPEQVEGEGWQPAGSTVRLGDVPIYAVDPLVRRSAALQGTPDAAAPAVHLSTAAAQKLGLEAEGRVRVRQGDAEAVLPWTEDARVPEGCCYLPGGTAAAAGLGAAYATVELERA